MKNSDKTQKLAKIILRISISLDISLYLCFFVGFALGIAGAELGFFMIGVVFRYWFGICIISLLLKLGILVLNFSRDTDAKRKMFFVALFSMSALLIISSAIWGIYYIGKVMSRAG